MYIWNLIYDCWEDPQYCVYVKGVQSPRLRCKLDLGSFAATLAASPFKASTLLLRTWATGRHWARVVYAQTKGCLHRFTLRDSDLPKDLHQVLAGPAHDIPASPKKAACSMIVCSPLFSMYSTYHMHVRNTSAKYIAEQAALLRSLWHCCLGIKTSQKQMHGNHDNNIITYLRIYTIHQVVDWRSFQNEN